MQSITGVGGSRHAGGLGLVRLTGTAEAVGKTHPWSLVVKRFNGAGAAENPDDTYINDQESFQTGVAKLRELNRGATCPTIGGYFNLRIERSDEPAEVQPVFPFASISIGGRPDAIA